MTHCERVLDLLSDGEWHSHHELYALHVIAHSRVAELRRRGYVIEIARDGDLYLYRLVSGPTALPADGRGVRPGEHGDRRLADQPSAGEPNGLSPWLVDATARPSSPVASSPAEQLNETRKALRLRFALNREKGLRREVAQLKDTTRFLHGVLLANGIKIPTPLNRPAAAGTPADESADGRRQEKP